MSKFLALLIALFMPFQAVVAMGASYCESELSSQNHSGHHVHAVSEDAPSQSDFDLSGPGDSSQKALTQSGDRPAPGAHHCGVCHFGCSAVITFTVSDLRSNPGMFSPVSHFSFFLSSPSSGRPERPKWSDLA